MTAVAYRLPQQLPSNAVMDNTAAGAGAAAALALEVQWQCSRIEHGQPQYVVTPDSEIKVEEGEVVVCVAGQKKYPPGPMNVGESLCYCHYIVTTDISVFKHNAGCI
jgi:hypothetical protein